MTQQAAPRGPPANSGKQAIVQAKPKKNLALGEVIAKHRGWSDAKMIKYLGLMLEQPNPSSKHKPGLCSSTIADYKSQLKVLATRLSEDWSGQPRHALPTYVECILRPNGPSSVKQYLTDAAETRRVAICLASVVSRCFPHLDDADKQRAVTAWRSLISESRKGYLQAREANGGFGGFFAADQLLTGEQMELSISKLPAGSAERCLLKLLQALVPHFPERHQVNSALLNLGHVQLVQRSAAPSLEEWAQSVVEDPDREAGLLVLGDPEAPSEHMSLYLLFDVTKRGPEFMRYNFSTGLTTEVAAYLAKLPHGLPWLFPQVKATVRASSKPYVGATGRDAFNARVNRILAKVFDVGDTAVTQTTFRLSLVHAYKKRLQQP